MTCGLLLLGFRRHQERRGVLPGSINQQAKSIRTFLRWYGDRALGEVRKRDIEQFLDERPIGPRTRYCYISNLHRFFAWAVDEGRLGSDPTERIPRPKLRNGLPRPADSSQLVSALRLAAPAVRCWILLAALQGLRCQEIAGLRVEDVIVGEALLRVVHGKGAKERLLPLHLHVWQALQLLPLPRSGWVFRTPMGGKYTPASLSEAFNRGLRELGVTATAHQLRHWFGTQLYQSTRDLRLVQELLGHASPATTAIYTAWDTRLAAQAVGDLSLGSVV